MPYHYIDDNGIVKDSSHWGYPGVYKPEKLGAEVGLFQGTIAGFWIGVVFFVLFFLRKRNQEAEELESKVETLEQDIQDLQTEKDKPSQTD